MFAQTRGKLCSRCPQTDCAQLFNAIRTAGLCQPRPLNFCTAFLLSAKRRSRRSWRSSTVLAKPTAGCKPWRPCCLCFLWILAAALAWRPRVPRSRGGPFRAKQWANCSGESKPKEIERPLLPRKTAAGAKTRRFRLVDLERRVHAGIDMVGHMTMEHPGSRIVGLHIGRSHAGGQ